MENHKKKKYRQKFSKMEKNVRNDVSECAVFNVATDYEITSKTNSEGKECFLYWDI